MCFDLIFIIVFGLMQNKKLKVFAPAIVWAIVILAVSSIPYLSSPSFGFKIEDKVAHFVEYLVLGVLLAYGFSRLRLSRSRIFMLSAGISGAFGILDELHQLLIPGRETAGLDMLADVLGSICAAGLYVIIFRRKL